MDTEKMQDYLGDAIGDLRQVYDAIVVLNKRTDKNGCQCETLKRELSGANAENDKMYAEIIRLKEGIVRQGADYIARSQALGAAKDGVIANLNIEIAKLNATAIDVKRDAVDQCYRMEIEVMKLKEENTKLKNCKTYELKVSEILPFKAAIEDNKRLRKAIKNFTKDFGYCGHMTSAIDLFDIAKESE